MRTTSQMKKHTKPVYKPSDEREMRDRMNGIRRDENGKITHIHGKPIVKQEEKVK